MGVLSRLNGVIRANLNALLDAAEDPERLIADTVDSMRSELKRAREDLVKTTGTARRIDKEAEELEREAGTWEERALLALRSGDEALAREALRQKVRCVKQAADARARAAQTSATADAMKDALERLSKKADDLEARRGALATEVRKARATPATPERGFGSAAFDELDRMAGRIDQLDAEVEAHAAIDDAGKKAELDARFRDLERQAQGADVEDALAALKRKLDA